MSLSKDCLHAKIINAYKNEPEKTELEIAFNAELY